MAQPHVNELIILGTGTSGSVPVIGCLTDPNPTCRTCTSPLPQNKRLNTSCLFRINDDKNLLVDCGKTFYTTALRWFPKYKLRRIDALLITHAHADAYFGLDDLRSWTLGSFIQPYIDVYCSNSTMVEIAKTFPYLVNKGDATGGGDLPEFRWHAFDEDKPFIIEACDGVQVTPLPVEHGRFFRTGLPFMNLGFRVGDFSYISDCSSIPERTTDLVRGSQVLIIDGLKWDPHASHFSIQEARDYVRDSFKGGERPVRNWLTGFTHSVEHEAATMECERWGKKEGRGVWIRPAWDGLRIGQDGLDAGQ